MQKRALVAGICAFVLTILGGIITASVWEWWNGRDHLGVYTTAVLTAVALIAAVVPFWPQPDRKEIAKNFKNLWPELSNLLFADTEKSVKAARQFINLPSGEPPPLYQQLDSPKYYHRKLIDSYDPQLGSALKQYYAADEALRYEASHYKPNLEIPGSNEALRKCAFDLEIASDELKRAVERRSQITRNE